MNDWDDFYYQIMPQIDFYEYSKKFEVSWHTVKDAALEFEVIEKYLQDNNYNGITIVYKYPNFEIDNLERGLASLSDEEKGGAFAQGIDKVYKQLMQCLMDAGVAPIEAVGKEFNPEIHNAVMHGEDESLGENIVAEEMQKGYMYKESVVRPSMVKVVN